MTRISSENSIASELDKTLVNLAKRANDRQINQLFTTDPIRAENLSCQVDDIFLDYSKQNITAEEINHLINLATQRGLLTQRAQMFAGEAINNTEHRSVLHSVLRAPHQQQIEILGKTAKEVIATEQKMSRLVDDIHLGKRVSITGEKFTDVLAIGIGGSFYGIKVGLSALHHCTDASLNVHVLANVDGAAVQEKLAKLNASTTLVVVISKTFTTQETLLNAQAVKSWMLSQFSHDIIGKQWFAVSSNIEQVESFGISADHVLPMWDWVGGRFSIWSAVGFSLALALGNQQFSEFKAGAYAMDCHFQQAPLTENMPVIMALLGIWNRNYLKYPCLAILPYAHQLRALPGYLQQTDMESNGKSVDKQGNKLPWLTAPVVFGQEGTNGQHAFMQLMHQSDDIIPTDFIVSRHSNSDYQLNHNVLVANCFAQSEALMQGKTLAQVEQELQAEGATKDEIALIASHKTMKGNTPSNTLLLNAITPKSFGALLALYEHKIFVQGAFWQINSFDQWGVELGKQLGKKVLNCFNDDSLQDQSLSASSRQLINLFREI
jgi:glucose-6-phosphate isomerase